MTHAEIVALLDRRADAFARRDVPALAGIHAATAVVESPMAGGSVTGPAAIGQLYESFFKAFPDATLTTEELVIDGDRVAQVATLAGTDSGGFLGLPASGKPFRVPLLILITARRSADRVGTPHLRFHRAADPDRRAEGPARLERR